MNEWKLMVMATITSIGGDVKSVRMGCSVLGGLDGWLVGLVVPLGNNSVTQ